MMLMLFVFHPILHTLIIHNQDAVCLQQLLLRV